MPTVAELIELMRNPGDDGLPDTIYDDLTSEYTNEIGGHVSALESANAAIQDREAEISRLKSMNYDLMIASQIGDDSVDNGGSDDDTADDAGIDDLF